MTAAGGAWRCRGGAWAAVARMRRALLLLALGASCAALMLYWRQQSYDSERSVRRRPHGALTNHLDADPQWTWTCRNMRCERYLPDADSPLQSLQTCNMLCASTQLWPQPTGPVSLATAAQAVDAHAFHLDVVKTTSEEVKNYFKEAFALMRLDLIDLQNKYTSGTQTAAATPVVVKVAINGSEDVRLRLNTDESYEIFMKPSGNSLVAEITARSFCGARHALETLFQLVWFDPYAAGGGGLMMLQAASIADAPRFSYRSLMLDTARNFFSVKDIIRTLDAMAANKLNTFHWHATDSQSFPLRLASTAKLADHGAYSPEQIYTVEDVKEVVHHARLRGIRVLIEIDAPAHVGRAWNWGPAEGLGELAQCVESQPWSMYCGEPPCGQLNPRNKNVYDILEAVYREVIQLTGVDDVFHLGGDEVSENCWLQHFNDTQPVELWLDFTRKALSRLITANGGRRPELTMLWSSKLTATPYLEMLDPKIAVQVWGSSMWTESTIILESGRRSVLSHVDAWYLDCGFGSWRDSGDGHCGPYRSWQQMYEHRPWSLVSTAYKNFVQGAAICMWTEQLGPEDLDSRVWPRTAAFAERLWTDCECVAERDVYLRLDTQRSRLIDRGIRAGPIWPRWCTQNPSQCLPF